MTQIEASFNSGIKVFDVDGIKIDSCPASVYDVNSVNVPEVGVFLVVYKWSAHLWQDGVIVKKFTASDCDDRLTALNDYLSTLPTNKIRAIVETFDFSDYEDNSRKEYKAMYADYIASQTLNN